MPRFTPIRDPSDLPAVGHKNEGEILDFKTKHDAAKPWEHAKDIGAFANHLGGTILIGAASTGEVITKYVPMTYQEADAAQTAYEKAAGGSCFPPPRIEVARVPHGSGVIVAVNIWPIVAQLACVFVRPGKLATGGYGHELLAFPIRVGGQTNYIEKENLAMYMNPGVRRNAILLNAIGPEERVTYSLPNHGGGTGIIFNVERVDEERNLLVLKSGSDHRRFPLDRVCPSMKRRPVNGASSWIRSSSLVAQLRREPERQNERNPTWVAKSRTPGLRGQPSVLRRGLQGAEGAYGTHEGAVQVPER
jgi:hypothetical protein